MILRWINNNIFIVDDKNQNIAQITVYPNQMQATISLLCHLISAYGIEKIESSTNTINSMLPEVKQSLWADYNCAIGKIEVKMI